MSEVESLKKQVDDDLDELVEYAKTHYGSALARIRQLEAMVEYRDKIIKDLRGKLNEAVLR